MMPIPRSPSRASEYCRSKTCRSTSRFVHPGQVMLIGTAISRLAWGSAR